MALSTYPGIPGQMPLAAIHGSSDAAVKQTVLEEAVAPESDHEHNPRERRVVQMWSGREQRGRPAIGAFHRCDVGWNQRASGQDRMHESSGLSADLANYMSAVNDQEHGKSTSIKNENHEHRQQGAPPDSRACDRARSRVSADVIPLEPERP